MKGQFIYKIINTVNGKFYVGSTTNTSERFRVHRNRLRKGRHHSQHLQAAWNKYGEKIFVFHVIEEVPIGESLQEAEDVWLAEHVGQPYCYNKSKFSDAPWRGVPKEKHPSFGRSVSEQQKLDISNTLKAYYAEDITNHPRFGKKHTPETIAKLSENRKGKGAGEEHYRYGKTLSDEVKAKIGDAQRGKPKGPGRKVSPEGRAKIRANIEAGRSHMHWLGKKHTEESKLKMSKPVLSMPDNIVFPSCTATLEHYGLKMPTLTRALKTGKPISKGRLAGYSFSYVTSLTEPTK